MADHHRVAKAGGDLRLSEPLGVGAQVEEAERVVGAELGGLLGEAAFVGETGDPRVRAHREVVPALRADIEVLRQLVVAVVRAAGRAGVRVRLSVRLGFRQRVFVLD